MGVPTKEFSALLKTITAKRPKTVIDHILKHGKITTDELRDLYGYNHPPRAARDVRELGVPLETFRLRGKDGRLKGAYRFGDLTKIRKNKLGGRRTWPKQFKTTLINNYRSRCAICHTHYEPQHLQIDHRVPYEIAGDSAGKLQHDKYMLVCGSCNRAKSWSCENCKNWTKDRNVDTCRSCYWASPDNYTHISLKQIRRLVIVWSENELFDYEQLIELSNHAQQELPEFVKIMLRNEVLSIKNKRKKCTKTKIT